MSALTPPRRRWVVAHPEVATSDEARRIAWHRWYGRALEATWRSCSTRRCREVRAEFLRLADEVAKR